jgi:acetyl-CoA/propionyl-CoA carboxylase, biotin carboxylase, biotin carboxyl carrier protein
MFDKVLVANRGEIAVRVIRACRDLGITAVAVHSPADADALHVRLADEAYLLPGSTAAESYLNVEAIMQVVDENDVDAVHPGYGFLSESTALAEALAARDKTFIGPGVAAIELMGSKISAREAAVAAGVPVVPGLTHAVRSADEVLEFAAVHGYPVAIKASYGGGGRGMKVVSRDEDVDDAFESAQREATAYFGRGDVYLERYLAHPKHIEMQIFADMHGDVVWLGERDCSVQRRHQKLVEESPAPGLPAETRRRMGEAAAAVARHVGYVNAGTVEFLVEGGEFFFLEMNTRLQVEHPVTELVTGFDLVAEQLRVAAGEPLSFTQSDVVSRGHAIEVRISAEDPSGGRFLPSPGRIERLQTPAGFGVRVDSGYASGDTVSEYYDGLVAKIICWGDSREIAIARTRRALDELVVEGIATTTSAQLIILQHPEFVAGTHDTRWLEEHVTLPDNVVDDAEGLGGDADAGTEPLGAPDRSLVEVGGRRFWIPRFEAGSTATASADPGASIASPLAGLARGSGTAARVGDGVIKAPMQGTVVKILVEVGQDVEASDIVCVLEAMKMENPIKAGRAGKVERIDVAPGTTVSPGEVMAVVA